MARTRKSVNPNLSNDSFVTSVNGVSAVSNGTTAPTPGPTLGVPYMPGVLNYQPPTLPPRPAGLPEPVDPVGMPTPTPLHQRRAQAAMCMLVHMVRLPELHRTLFDRSGQPALVDLIVDSLPDKSAQELYEQGLGCVANWGSLPPNAAAWLQLFAGTTPDYPALVHGVYERAANEHCTVVRGREAITELLNLGAVAAVEQRLGQAYQAAEAAAMGYNNAIIALARAERDKVVARVAHVGNVATQTQWLTGSQLMARDAQLEYLIPGVLVRHQLAVIGGPTKALKSGISGELAIAISSDHPDSRFLGHYPVPLASRGTTLLVSSEAGEASCRSRLMSIARARGLAAIPERLQVWTGTVALGDRAARQEFLQHVRATGARQAIIDPISMNLYRGLPKDSQIETSSVHNVSEYVQELSAEFAAADCTLVLVAHTHKAGMTKYEPMELHELSGAGIHESARQWFLVRRRKRFDAETGDNELFLEIGSSDGCCSAWAVDIHEGAWSPTALRAWEVTMRRQSELAVQARNAAEQATLELVTGILQAAPPAGLSINAIRQRLSELGQGRGVPKVQLALSQLGTQVRANAHGQWQFIHVGPTEVPNVA